MRKDLLQEAWAEDRYPPNTDSEVHPDDSIEYSVHISEIINKLPKNRALSLTRIGIMRKKIRETPKMKTKHGAEFADVRKFISDGQRFHAAHATLPRTETPLGSALALKLLLNALGKTAGVVCSNPVRRFTDSCRNRKPSKCRGCRRAITVIVR